MSEREGLWPQLSPKCLPKFPFPVSMVVADWVRECLNRGLDDVGLSVGAAKEIPSKMLGEVALLVESERGLKIVLSRLSIALCTKPPLLGEVCLDIEMEAEDLEAKKLPAGLIELVDVLKFTVLGENLELEVIGCLIGE